MILNKEQLIELTGRKRSAAQSIVLKRLGITYRERGDGTLVVSEAHVQETLGATVGLKRKAVEPEWQNA